MPKSVQKLKIIFVLSVGLFIPLLATAGLSPVKDYTYGAWDIDLVGKYYYTNSNFNATGTNSFTSLPYNDYLQTASGDLLLRTVLPHTKWAFYADAQMASTNARTYSSTNTYTNLSFVKAGTDYVLYQGFISLIPEFSVQVPVTTIDFTTQNAAISDGVTEASARMLMEFYWKRLTLGGYGGYTYRSSGRSSLGVYGGYAQIAFQRWEFGGKLIGYTSVTNDQDTSNTGYRYVWALNADGGSLAYGSVNPNYIEADGWVTIRVSPNFSVSGGGGSGLAGNNTANGWNLAGGISYRFGGTKFARKMDPDEFHEEVSDGVDQRLFQPAPPAQPKPAPVVRPAPVYQAPKPPAQTTKSIQQQLNDTEMQLEMKKKPARPPEGE